MSMSLFDQSQSIWKSIEVQISKDIPEAAIKYRDTLSIKYANGKTKFFRYTLKYNGEKSGLEFRFPEFFLRNKVVAGSMKYIKPDIPINLNEKVNTTSPFDVIGSIANWLSLGGAYTNTEYNLEYLEIATHFVRSLCKDDLSMGSWYISDEPWSDYFFNVVWDKTLIYLSEDGCDAFLFMATDVD